MQNQPGSLLRLEFSSIPLPSDFPIAGGGIYHQQDTPITRLHLHDCLELGYCHEGTGIFVIEDKVFPYQTGDVSVINDREAHLAQAARGTVSRWTWVSVDPARLIEASSVEPALLRIAPLGGSDFPNILPSRTYPTVGPLVVGIIQELEARSPGYRSAVRGMMWTLMVRLHRIAGDGSETPPPARRDVLERIAPALQHVTHHFAEPIAVEQLAELCHTSVTNLRRLFHAGVGRSPQQYLVHVRVQMAATLLQSTTRPILEIALDVGYPTLSSFNRHFKRVLGMTPRQWRRQG